MKPLFLGGGGTLTGGRLDEYFSIWVGLKPPSFAFLLEGHEISWFFLSIFFFTQMFLCQIVASIQLA